MTGQDPMLPVPPPPGLTRRQRRMWVTADEARRGQYAATHPDVDRPALSRSGRRVFRQERTEQTRQRVREERRTLTDTRARGAQIILGALALVMVGFWLWPSTPVAVPAPSPAAAAAPPSTTTNLAAPTPQNTVRAVSGPQPAAVDAALTWWSVACQHTPDQWGPLQPLMTEAGWEEAASTPAPVLRASWVCVDLEAEQDRTRPDGSIVVRLRAQRTVSPVDGGGGAPFVEAAAESRVVSLVDGQWLVGTSPAN